MFIPVFYPFAALQNMSDHFAAHSANSYILRVIRTDLFKPVTQYAFHFALQRIRMHQLTAAGKRTFIDISRNCATYLSLCEKIYGKKAMIAADIGKCRIIPNKRRNGIQPWRKFDHSLFIQQLIYLFNKFIRIIPVNGTGLLDRFSS